MIKISLYKPGMNAIFRAGAGGLACTLEAMRHDVEHGVLRPEQIPGYPWNGGPPWKITSSEIELYITDKDFMRKLFEYAFQIKERCVFLPGQFGGQEMAPAKLILVEMHNALDTILLNHNKSSDVSNVTTFNEPIDDEMHVISMRPKTWYVHQKLFLECLDENFKLRSSLIPGTECRHTAYPQTARYTPFGLEAVFVIVAARSYRISDLSGVLVIPEVTDLLEFAQARQHANPRKTAECVVGNIYEAALDFEITYESYKGFARKLRANCIAMCVSKKNKNNARTKTFSISRDADVDLSLYDQFRGSCKPPKLLYSKNKKKKSFGALRSFIAENLGNGRLWYEGFDRLWGRLQTTANRGEEKNSLVYETGVRKMLNEDKLGFQTEDERQFYELIAQAWRVRQAQIFEQNEGNPAAGESRVEKERSNWLRCLGSAKTEQQLMEALNNIYVRAGHLSGFGNIAYRFPQRSWQQAQSLAVVAIVCYTKKPKPDGTDEDDVTEQVETVSA